MTRKPIRNGVLLGSAAFVMQLLLQGSHHWTALPSRVEAMMSHAFQAMAGSPAAMLWLAYYALVGVAVHAAVFMLTLRVTRDLTLRPGPLRPLASQRGFALLAVLLVFGALLTWNALLFPRGPVRVTGAPDDLLHWLPVIACSALPLVMLIAWFAGMGHRPRMAVIAAIALLAGAGLVDAERRARHSGSGAPDVIVLGIDSLRPDHLSLYGDPATAAPNVDAFVRGAVSFDNTYTTQGRTFVAYMSVLSGRYPVHNGVRENLYPRALFERTQLLPHTYRAQGYSTVFALDETRFANIDAGFGFDSVASPPPGLVEVVASTLFNSAGTNLVQLVPGAWRLLPHAAGNRALLGSYAPSAQGARIDAAIRAAAPDRPLFLMAHFCSAHVPFAAGRWHSEPLGGQYADSPRTYRKALHIADRQVARVLDTLRETGRLRNAIVVLLSDHGEGLNMRKDRWKAIPSASAFYTPGNYGHGNMALEDTESRVLLAMQRFVDGKPAWKPARVATPASLIDIAPTLVSLSGPPSAPGRFDGIPLVDASGQSLAPNDRPLFIESGIFGRSLETLEVDDREVANEFVHLYRVTSDLRLELKTEALPGLLAKKQRAVVLGRYGVSTMPQSTPAGCWLVADFADRTRQCVARPQEHPIAAHYSRLICEQFRDDGDFSARWCSSNASASSRLH
jgi:hypothetical protein